MRIIRSFINITANDAVIESLDNYLNDCDFHDITSFVQSFYDDAAINDNGVSNKWSLDNVGSKWIYLYDNINAGYFSIESALYYPDKFISHLYRLLSPYDEDLTIEKLMEIEQYQGIVPYLVLRSIHSRRNNIKATNIKTGVRFKDILPIFKPEISL